jgi:hypothetical protein
MKTTFMGQPGGDQSLETVTFMGSGLAGFTRAPE